MFHKLNAKQVERQIRRNRIVNRVTGEEYGSEDVLEVSMAPDASVDSVTDSRLELLDCGHIHYPDTRVARCSSCSEKQGRTVFVCQDCAVVCPLSGQTLCRRCTQLGPDGQYYEPKALQKAIRAGRFEPPAPPASPAPRCSPSRNNITGGPSLLSRFLEWW